MGFHGVQDVVIPPADPQVPSSAYVHVPFCSVRCGYCDFNTYINDFGPGASRHNYAESVLKEIELAARYFPGPFETVFFGGGTPTLLSADALGSILRALPVAEGAEITVEANPETITEEIPTQLAQQGFNRVSVGMQSAVPSVLATLDRTHRPERLPDIANWVKDAGLAFSVDLIYGTPGETLSDWERSLDQALALDPDHISAYSLILEPGTKMYAEVQHGKLPTPDPDDAADKYLIADRMLSAAGFQWYEISNFAKVLPGENDVPATSLKNASKHNLAYWRDWNWWGFGPGAHSHSGDTRWWNVKHPLAYAQRLEQGRLPVQEGEKLTDEQRQLEQLMLQVRTADGWEGSIPGLLENGRLTLQGRLMADHVTRVLAGWEEAAK